MFSKFLSELGYEINKDNPDMNRVLAVISPLEANLSSLEKCGFAVKNLEDELDGIKFRANEIERIQTGKREVKTGYEIKDALYQMHNKQFELRRKFDRIIEGV